LDSAIAKLEATTFSPISQRATLIGKTLKQQLDSFIFGKGKQTTSPSIIPLAITSWSQRITHLISNQKITNINLDNSKSQLPVIRQTLTQKISRFIPNSQITTQNATEIESQTPKVLDLIQQAIYYFFGFQSTPKLHTSQNLDTAGRKTLFSKSVKAALPQSDYQDETEDLWLTFGDLFGEEIEISTEVTTETSQPQLNSRKPNSKLLKEYQTGGNLVKNRSKNQSSIVNQSSEKQKSRRITLPKPEKTVISPSSNSKTAVKPDYIEIDATTVSYEKHPVELILEWLDLIILWVEERIAIVFRFLQRLFGA
jgi:hypothetical protein